MEADCSFHIGYKVNANDLCVGIKYNMRLTQRREYHKESVGNKSYLSIMSEIGELFDRTVK